MSHNMGFLLVTWLHYSFLLAHTDPHVSHVTQRKAQSNGSQGDPGWIHMTVMRSKWLGLTYHLINYCKILRAGPLLISIRGLNSSSVKLSGVLIQYEGLLHRLVVHHAPLHLLLVELLLLSRGEVPRHLVEAEPEQLEDPEQLLPPVRVLDQVHDSLRVVPQKVRHLPGVNLDHCNRDRVEIIRT